jgi:D-beta-D-heptose 7-phosphate kinase/D-beta-D-heptose 1-phosphate adenosyltransferase
MFSNFLDFSDCDILVVGDCMLDSYWHGSTKRISPEAPVPVVGIDILEDRAGGAANVAVNTSNIGIKTTLVSLAGADKPGKKIQHLLKQQLIDCDFILSNEITTTTKTRIVSQNQQLLRIDKETYPTTNFSTLVEQKCFKYIPNVNAVIISDYNKGCLVDCKKIIAYAKKYKKLVVVDPKGKNYYKYYGASIITPNLSEFEEVVGKCNTLKEIPEKAIKLIKQLNINALLVTLSEKGMMLVTKDGRSYHLQAASREVFDVTGAGDTVISVLASFISKGYDYLQAAKIANIAAGIVVEKSGTSPITLAELIQKLNDKNHSPTGVLSLKNLMKCLAIEHLNNKKIVFTNGCFDILHAGHIKYLQAAKNLGDKLIVAVNSDSSVKQLKGNNRPINNLSRRMAVLAGLKSVDWVVSFDDLTPEKTIQKIKPDVLVKGGDYNIDNIVGSSFVKSYGGTVEIIDFLIGHSTTSIIEKCLSLS